MNANIRRDACTKQHQFISSRIQISRVFLRLADTTSNGDVRERCIGDALNAFGDAIDYLEADRVMTPAQRHDIEGRLDELHGELKHRQEIVGHVSRTTRPGLFEHRD